MTKTDALTATARRFTNLMDGSVLPNVDVTQIINYYENLMFNSTLVINVFSNIESNFQEDEIEEYLNEADYWDGDESDKINY